MSIDPEKLLELAKERHSDDGVTLAWPTVLKIIDELRERNALAAHVERIIEARNSNRGDTLANVCAVIDEATHQTSLAHMKAAWQAEAFEIAERHAKCEQDAAMLRLNAADLRRQAEGGSQ